MRIFTVDVWRKKDALTFQDVPCRVTDASIMTGQAPVIVGAGPLASGRPCDLFKLGNR